MGVWCCDNGLKVYPLGKSAVSCFSKVEPAVLNRHLHVDDSLGSIRERLVLSAVGVGPEGVEHHLDGIGKVLSKFLSVEMIAGRSKPIRPSQSH